MKQSTWHKVDKDWILLYDKNKEQKINLINSILNQDEINLNEIFSNSESDEIKIGSVVMSPIGIGRLIKIEEVNNKINYIVKYLTKDNQEEPYELTEISNFVSLNVNLGKKEINKWLRLNVAVCDKVGSILRLMEHKGYKSHDEDFNIIYNGKRLLDDTLIEHIDFLPNSKILLMPLVFKPSKLKRFTYNYSYWSVYKEDGVTFSVSKQIRLIGVSINKLCEQRVNCNTVEISVHEGDSQDGLCLHSQDVEMSYTPNSTEEETLIEVMFTKSIKIMEGTEYTLMLRLPNPGECHYFYYGSSGNVGNELENGVTMTFKETKGMNSYSTGGLFPYIYYSS